ncbi:MAG TPA: M28 family metallopeptidase [Bryobacteraceae bacterium]|nr:M28 family metallopeptidase [Bryobacteraceae bacterium]
MYKILLSFTLSTVLGLGQQPIRGFPSDLAKSEFDQEEKARAIPEAARIRTYMERMSREPHHAGSPASMAVAAYAAGLFKEWGLDVEIEPFEALLPYPTHRSLEMTRPVKYKAKLHEQALPEDKNSGDKNQLPSYNAYSAAGDVTAPLVYVNYGIPADYDELNKLGVDVKGKIVIARYGKSWRGTKPKVAYEHGAIGCLIYSDPRDDGYFMGDVYPKGPFRPAQSVQRGSVMDMPLYVGDPLSPGWASEKGSKRLAMKDSTVLMKIPVLPISYEDAKPLLANLGGPVAPEAWRGALPITYHIGPGAATVHLKLDFDFATRPVYNVIATIPGSSEPDEWIMYGNHHDAWVNGANDPLSGACSLLETARTLAEMRKQGWKPQRTVKFALWDAEEFGLVGSTEWVEKHQEELSGKLVIYFNSDSNGKGVLAAGGSPALQEFLAEVLRDVRDPVTKDSLLKMWKSKRLDTAAAVDFSLDSLGAGSDYVAFYHHLGIASMNLGFSSGGQSGVYHSIYDSFHWYTTFSDGDFAYGRALSQVMATALMRFAEAPLLPFEFHGFVKTVSGYLDQLKALPNASKVDFRELVAELERLDTASARYESQLKRGAWARASAHARGDVNAVLYKSERSLIQERGLPGRAWYKNQIAAPGMYTGYNAKTLAGIREAMEMGRWDEANRETKSVLASLRSLHSRINEAAKLMAAF